MSAIANALYLVRKAVANQATGLSFSKLNEGSGIPQGSAHRIVKELVALNIMNFDAANKTYRGGLMLASLGAQILSQYSLREVARPSLETLHDALGQVVTLAIRDGSSGIYIDKIEAVDMGLRLHSEIGKPFPLHCTAMGKILLAHADKATQNAVLGQPLKQITPHTITDPARLEAALADVLAQGYAIDDEEITRGLVCTAAPIFGIGGEIAGALSFTSQKHIFEELGPETIINHVIRAAKQASL